jgi:hypothetical protein
MAFGKGQRKNVRRFPNGKGLRPDCYEMRVRDAAERQAAYDKLTIQQKLDALDVRLGAGKGATKQRARLQDALEKSRASGTVETKAPKKGKVAK